jgi:hypothetical protein
MKHYSCTYCGGTDFIRCYDGRAEEILLCRYTYRAPEGQLITQIRERRAPREYPFTPRFTCERNGIYCRTCERWLGPDGWMAFNHGIEENEGLLSRDECLRILSEQGA